MLFDKSAPPLPKMCPTAGDSLCSNIFDRATCIVDDALGGDNLIAFWNHSLRFDQQSETYQELERAKVDLQDMILLADDLQTKAETYSWIFQVARICNLLLASFCLFLIAGLTWRNQRIVKVLRHWIAVPFFGFLVFSLFCFSITFVIMSIMLADFCIDSPDAVILNLLERYKSQFSPLLRNFFIFYINRTFDNSLIES